MGIDVAPAVVIPQLAAADGLRLPLLSGPVLLQAPGLGLGDVDDRAVLGRREVSHLHLTLAETAQGRERLEVGGLDEAEVVGVDTVDVVHHDPLLLANALPDVRSLTACALGVNLLSMVVVEVVDAVRNHILDAAGVLLRHVGHEVTPVGHGADVGIEHLNRRVGILEQQLRLGLQGCERLVGIAVVELGVAAGLLTDSEVDHRLAHLRVPNSLRCPGAAQLPEAVGEQAVDARHVVRPVDEVVGGHQHQSAVVAPAELVGALPLRGAYALLLAENVEVGHGDVELAVRRTVDVRVADAVLLGYRVARDDRLAVVHGRKGVAVVADGHKQPVGRVAEVGEEVGTHVLFGECAGGL